MSSFVLGVIFIVLTMTENNTPNKPADSTDANTDLRLKMVASQIEARY
jgi:hypothetical protein